MQTTTVTNAHMGGPPPVYQERDYQDLPPQQYKPLPPQPPSSQPPPPPPAYTDQHPVEPTLSRELNHQAHPQSHSQAQQQPRAGNADSTTMPPCVVPQTTKTWKGPYNCPFVRAYPPGLAEHGISQETFMSFIDTVNESFVTSPVFYVTGTAAHFMSMAYGVQPVQWAGIGLGVANTVASGVTSYLRTRHVFRKANEELFRPHGLTATVLTTKKLAQKVEYPHKKLQLLPIEHDEEAMRSHMSSVSLSSSSSSSSSSYSSSSSSDSDSDSDFENKKRKYRQRAKERMERSQKGGGGSGPSGPNGAGGAKKPGADIVARRIQGFDGYVQPLNFDVPPSERSENLLRRMGEKQAERLASKQQRRMDKKRAKGFAVRNKMERKARRHELKTEKVLGRLEYKLEHTESASKQAKIEARMERRMAKGERIAGKARAKGERVLDKKVNKKESKIANKVRWIVISEWSGEKEGEEDDEVMYQDEDEILSRHEEEFIEEEAKKFADSEEGKKAAAQDAAAQKAI